MMYMLHPLSGLEQSGRGAVGGGSGGDPNDHRQNLSIRQFSIGLGATR